jgi:hypothetical protein
LMYLTKLLQQVKSFTFSSKASPKKVAKKERINDISPNMKC